MTAFADTAKTMPGFVAVWNQSRDGTTWTDEGTNGLDLTAVGATWVASGGPDTEMPGHWSLDGVDDLLRRMAHDSELNLGASGDGEFWIAFWVRRTLGSTDSFAPLVAKGDNTYQVRITNSAPDVRFDVRGGTGGAEVVEASDLLVVGEWTFFIVHQQTSPDIIAVYTGDTTTAPSLVDSTARSGTVGTDTNSTFTVGAQDNSGTLRRFYRGDFVGVAVGTGAFLNATQREDLWAATFEAPSSGGVTNTATVAAATSDGLAAAVTASVAVTNTATVAEATSEGLDAQVQAGTPVTAEATVAAATADGLNAEVTAATAVTTTASVAEATAEGLDSLVTAGTQVTLTATIAAATSDGLDAEVTSQSGVLASATIAEATAEGLAAQARGGAEIILQALVGEATAHGLAASVVTSKAPDSRLYDLVMFRGRARTVRRTYGDKFEEPARAPRSAL